MAPVTPATVTAVPAKQSKAESYLPLPRRQFYHSQTGQPMSLEEVISDRDSEDEVANDVADLEIAQLQMVEDSMDDNENVEKFMHIWNSFVKKQRVLGDCHIPWACEAFSRFHEKELNRNSSLSWCWRLFMIKLWGFGLVDASTINKCNTILENCRNGLDTNNTEIAGYHPSDPNTKKRRRMKHRNNLDTNNNNVNDGGTLQARTGTRKSSRVRIPNTKYTDRPRPIRKGT